MKTLKKVSLTKNDFCKINSSKLIEVQGLEVKGSSSDRKVFLKNYTSFPPPLVSSSDFVPKSLIEHLMRNKKDTAIGIKYIDGDQVTNMEGCMHTFVTPLCNSLMSGDYIYQGGHTAVSLEGKLRPLIISAAVQPDFENDEVLMKIVEPVEKEIKGEEINFKTFQPLYSKGINKSLKEHQQYEEMLQKHMIYHLYKDHILPSVKDIKNVLSPSESMKFIEKCISDKKFELSGNFVKVGYNHILSLEGLFHVYLEQIRNEFSVFEGLLTQGYVYTINPPKIFASEINPSNVPILNRLQCLAFACYGESTFKNLKIIGFDTFADKSIIEVYEKVFKKVKVIEKIKLNGTDGKYPLKEDYALIIHNNSDAFGQNIEFEGSYGSLDGAIGCYSNASSNLKRERKDLLDFIL